MHQIKHLTVGVIPVMSKEHFPCDSDLDASWGLCDVELFSCQVQYFCLEIIRFINSYYHHKMLYVQCHKFQIYLFSNT